MSMSCVNSASCWSFEPSPPRVPFANCAAIFAAMAAAAAAASDADLLSSTLALLAGAETSSPGAGWSHFLLDGLGGSGEASDILALRRRVHRKCNDGCRNCRICLLLFVPWLFTVASSGSETVIKTFSAVCSLNQTTSLLVLLVCFILAMYCGLLSEPFFPDTVMPLLPAELIDMIIDHLHSDKKTLATCTLVSQSWLKTSRFHLIPSITISPKNFNTILGLLTAPHSRLATSVGHLALAFFGFMKDPSGPHIYSLDDFLRIIKHFQWLNVLMFVDVAFETLDHFQRFDTKYQN